MKKQTTYFVSYQIVKGPYFRDTTVKANNKREAKRIARRDIESTLESMQLPYESKIKWNFVGRSIN